MENTKRARIMRVLKYVAVLLIIAGLATALGILAANLNYRRNELEGVYQKAYFECMESLNDLELKMSKLQLSTSGNSQRKLLTDISSDSAVVQTNLATLATNDTESSDIIGFFNKLGDYSKTLAAGVSASPLTDDNRATVKKLHTAVVAFRSELSSVQDEIMNGGKLLGSVGKSLNYIDASFGNIKNSSLDIPELIYDGPFSDALNDRETKFLNGLSEISADEAKQKVESVFEGATVELTGEAGRDIATYLFSLSGSLNGTVQISKLGGYILLFDCYNEPLDTTIEESDAEKIAGDFVSRLGYAGMIPVWISNNNSTYYVNMAFENNGVVYYPDLVKVKIAADTGAILGLEARNYIFNHAERALQSPVEEPNARAALPNGVTVKTSRLTLIPTEWNSEILAYEYEVEYENETYYIYVDAVNAEEIKVMKVIEDDGKLVA